LFLLTAMVFAAGAVCRGATDISVQGNQFDHQYVDGYALNNPVNVTDDQADDATFPDNMANPGWGHVNTQNLTITAGSYKSDGSFNQQFFSAISKIRIWTLCIQGQETRIPAQVAISYTTATNVPWNNWYNTSDQGTWPFPVTISSVNGKPVNVNSDGSVNLYDGKTSAFMGSKPGTKYRYVDLDVDIPAGTTSVLFQFGPQKQADAKAGSSQTWGALIAEIQTLPTIVPQSVQGPRNIVVKTGQKVAFLGDSITALGWESSTGYVRLVGMGLAANGVKIAPIPAGISGNTSGDERVRFDADVISKKPDWLTLSCGVNDVWHNPGGVPLDQYKKNITEMVDKADAAGVKVVILTSTMIGEDQPNNHNQRLIPYNDFLRQLAAERKYPLADLNADMQADVQDLVKAGWKPGHLLTMDGVHMNPHGHIMMASGILKAMGMDDAQLTRAKNLWLDMPHGWSTNLNYQITVTPDLTLRQYLALQSKTPKGSDGSVPDLLQSIYNDSVPGLLSPGNKSGIDELRNKLQEKLNQDIDQKLKP
jgi:lysophospholipase L1-like esterase